MPTLLCNFQHKCQTVKQTQFTATADLLIAFQISNLSLAVYRHSTFGNVSSCLDDSGEEEVKEEEDIKPNSNLMAKDVRHIAGVFINGERWHGESCGGIQPKRKFNKKWQVQ